MRGQDLSRRLLAFVDDAADLLVDDLGGRLGNIFSLRDRVPEKHLLLVFGVAQWSELLAEPELGHHAACETRGTPDVVGRARRHLVRPENELLGDAAAEEA